MNKIKIFLSGFVIIMILALFTAFNSPKFLSTCDSPIVGDHSGAPGETNCTYCHAGSPNTGPGTLEFHVGNDSTYVPGQTYNCSVKMIQGTLSKFGFVDLALKNSGNTTIGIFNLIDTLRTRKYTLGSRNYISHTSCGADADTLGRSYWNYSWTAPATNVGTIKLYISGLAANHDEATTGDYTYTSVITLSPTTAGINVLDAKINELILFPNPASDHIRINYTLTKRGVVTANLFLMSGEFAASLLDEFQNSGNHSKEFQLPVGLAKGNYILKVSVNGISTSRKIVIL